MRSRKASQVGQSASGSEPGETWGFALRPDPTEVEVWGCGNGQAFCFPRPWDDSAEIVLHAVRALMHEVHGE